MISAKLFYGFPLAAATLALISCASPRTERNASQSIAATPSIASAKPSEPASFPDGLHWYRDSAEQRAIYLQTFRAAADAARRLSRRLPARERWGVILDIDETLLDNSEYNKRLAENNQRYDARTFDDWIQEKNAPALPGAKPFIDTILDELHGQIALVTNRTAAQCDATKENLHRVGLRYSQVKCDNDPDAKGDKNRRFKEVADGDAEHLPMKVLIYIGDNIQDFPDLGQTSPGDFSEFGATYFALPNPMYGSWQQVPAH